MKVFRRIICLIISIACLSFMFSCNKITTLNSLGEKYKQEILAQARINAGSMVGNFEIVVLDATKTKENIQSYSFSPVIDLDKITAGLFVKFDVTNGGETILYTIYYNFGLQFSEEQTENLQVTFNNWVDVWELEVVEQNKTILFEYSIT